MVITKTAIRIYENRGKANSIYGKPMIAIPVSAVEKCERLAFDHAEDPRMSISNNGGTTGVEDS